jgi:hypothetical protein
MRPLIPAVALASVAWAVSGCAGRVGVVQLALDASTEGASPAVELRADAAAGDADPDTYADAGRDGVACAACTTNSDCPGLSASSTEFIPAPTCVQGRCEFLSACAPLGPDGGKCSPDEYGLECIYYVPSTCRPIGSPPPGVRFYCCPCGGAP